MSEPTHALQENFEAAGVPSGWIDPDRLDLPSASAWHFWACAGQRNLQSRIPAEELKTIKDAPDELRDSGTRLHKAREMDNPGELNEEEIEIYQKSIVYEQRLVSEWQRAHAIETFQEGPREERIFLHDISTMRPLTSGKLDVHYLAGNHALIIDRKTGFVSNLVAATGNSQLRLQAVLLWREHDGLEMIRVAFDKSRFDPSKADFCDYTAMDLKYSYDSIVYWLWWTTQPDAPRQPGPHCVHCPCRAHCPEAAAYALLPSVMVEPGTPVEKVDELDLIKLWEMKSIVENILKAVVTRLKGMGAKRLNELGLDYAKPRELNPITNPKGAYDFLKTVQNWPEQDLWNALEFSNTDLAKLAMREKGLDQKSATAWVRAALKDYITTKTCEAALKKI